MSRLDDLRMVDPVLTTIVQGYSNASMVGGHLFPVVNVSRLKGKIPVFGKEAFINRDSYRAIRADSNRIPPSGLELIQFETKERDIETAIDYIEEEESSDFFRLEQRIARELMDILLLGHEIEVAEYVQKTDNYDPAMRLIIDGNTSWLDSSNGSDPIEDIKDGMAAIRSRIARYPNTMILGAQTFRIIMNHVRVTERIKYSGITNASVQLLSELTGIPDIYIGLAVKTDDGINFTDVWKDNAVIAYTDKSDARSRSEYNPSFGYTFRREGKPEVDTYYENGGKIKVIRNTDNYCVKVTAPDAAYLIYGANT